MTRGAYAAVLLACGVASAEPRRSCSTLRLSLELERDRADRWNLAWQLALTGAAIGQSAVAITPVADRGTRMAAWVGAAESAFAAGGSWLLPLRLEAPDDVETLDCAEVSAAEDRAARAERRTFWLLHAGNVVVNATGGIVLAELTSWERGALSFALGYSVGLLQIYTLPHPVWRDSFITAIPSRGGWTIGMARRF